MAEPRACARCFACFVPLTPSPLHTNNKNAETGRLSPAEGALVRQGGRPGRARERPAAERGRHHPLGADAARAVAEREVGV